MRISDYPLSSSLLLVLGLLMLPPIRRFIIKLSGFKVPHPVAPLAVGVGILAAILLQANAERAVKEAEKVRLMQIEAEENRKDSTFIASHPFVDRGALRAWRASAADSSKNPSKTLAAFLEEQQAIRNKWIADSIETARKLRQDSILAEKQRRKDSVDAAKEARRLLALEQQRARAYERESAPETYNGHTVYTGRRGGRYYINSNGNKTYIR